MWQSCRIWQSVASLFINVFHCLHVFCVCFYAHSVNWLSFILGILFPLTNCRYRRALSNNCTEGTLLKYSPRRQKCPSRLPRGLQLFTSEGTLVATLGRNVTFLVFLEEVLTYWIKKKTSKQTRETIVYTIGCMLLHCTVHQDAVTDISQRLKQQHIK